MIGYIEGQIKFKEQHTLLVVTSGVGYRVFVTQNTHAVSHIGQSVELFIYTSVKDDAIDLFGFLSEQELTFFTMLLTVNGVGPKSALSVLNLGVDVCKNAIQHADTHLFSQVPRLGKKTAQKIIIELQSKLGELEILELTSQNSDLDAAIQALSSMGYDKQQIIEASRKLPKELSLDTMIKQLIKTLGAHHDKS
jgi:Holliday junction DNA helicase RuvA